ncbi:polysaccharide biosynthesis/export family protein [Microvirga sp. P5_D2]
MLFSKRMTMAFRCFVALAAMLAFPTYANALARVGVTEGDKLRITVFGQSDLSGEVIVSAERSITLPLLGPINVDQRSTREVEASLVGGFSEALGRPVSVRVELLERQPIYVVGAVNTPGQYMYRPGIAVLHAVAMAGGLESPLKNGPYLFIEAAREQTRVSTQLESLKLSLAQYSRLNAERDQLERATLSSRLLGIAGQEEGTALMVKENQILNDERQKLAQQVARHKEAAELAREEVAAYDGQLSQIKIKGTIAKAELDNIRGLREQGLTTRVRTFELEKLVPELNAEERAVLASIARAKQAVATAERSAEEVPLKRSLEVKEKLANLTMEIARKELEIRGSSQLSQIASSGASLGRATAQARYEVVRQGAEGLVTIAADELTAVLPGDVVRVKLTSEVAFQAAPARRLD